MEKTEYISLNKLIDSYSSWKYYLLSSKYKILGSIVIGAAIGTCASFLIPPRYTANLSFAIQENDKSSGLSSLASQFGFSLGGSDNGAFGGDNLYELLMSRALVEKALLSPVDIDSKKENLLNIYLTTYKYNNDWKTSTDPKIRELDYPVDQDRKTFTRSQDSVFKIVCEEILLKRLTVKKRSKKLSIGDVSFTSQNELLSKLFVENLMQETSSFYVETKTKLARSNYLKLINQTDSIKHEYENALAARAGLADQTVNSVRQSSTVGLIKKQTDIQILAGTYIEMKKNLEIMKLSLDKETPLIEIIDNPILPLEKHKLGKIKGFILGSIIGGFLAILTFTSIYGYQKLKERNGADK